MKKLSLGLLLLTLLSQACGQEQRTDLHALFLEFWTYMDENYIYFEEKQIDWEAVKVAHEETFNAFSTEEQLFEVIEASLLLLQDHHNRLYTPLGQAQSYDYREDYPIHFSIQNIQDHYLEQKFKKLDGLYYGLIDGIAYIYISRMRNDGKLQQLIQQLYQNQPKGLILDIRSNGGGNSNGVPHLLGDFVKEKQYLGAYIEKKGPGHQDKTQALPVYAYPNKDFHFDKPLVVLTNRESYSASSYFAAMFKGLDQVQLIGQRTGGGGGGNSAYELSNGWILSISVSDFIDKEGNSIEAGVLPDKVIENTREDVNLGRDRMLEKAMEVFR